MTAQQVISQITAWLRQAILLGILVAAALLLLRGFGVQMPVRGLDHIALAYIAGAYWLTK